jgi:hypothetical protein
MLDVWAVPAAPGSRADRLEPAGALVLRLRYGATSLLLPGDLVAEQGQRIVAARGGPGYASLAMRREPAGSL